MTQPLPRLPRRTPDTHKWDVGAVLVVAGAPGMTGAAYMAAKSALRSGAGIVVTACSKAVEPILASKHTCVMVRGFEATPSGGLGAGALEPILELSERFDAVVIGPGLGRERPTLHLVRSLVRELKKKIVLDADGLFAFEDALATLDEAKGDLVLTPHMGELTRLSPRELLKFAGEDREGMVRAALEKAPRVTLVLKGKNTLVGRKGEIFTNDTGNPGMATAGSGDVLSGVIGALLAQGLDAWDAARLGVWLHGRAGDLVAARVGAPLMIATDIMEEVPHAIAERMKGEAS
jgi:NAD(P)H-hydrate epimerase